MRSYECTIALHPDLGEAGVHEQVERVKSIIGDNGGSVKQVAEWGPRELAYPIQKERRGIFQVVVFDGSGETVSELERNLRIAEQVLRYITVRVDSERAPLDLGRPRRNAEEETTGEQEEVPAAAPEASSDVGPVS